jgi:quercetin dioxygenase-like cupin family protein
MNFYDQWLELGDIALDEKAASRKVIHSDELEWVATAQDARAALLVSRETGFRTWGTTTMRAEIPVGWNTGQHKHGEEAIYIITGRGYTVADGVRYDWRDGSTLLMPFGGVHQHFNDGDTPVHYLSALSVGLEHFVGIHRTIQFENCGRTQHAPDVDVARDGVDPEGNRVVLNIEDASVKESRNHVRVQEFMSIRAPVHGFNPKEIEISGILTDGPHSHGGKHAHMEAHIHILEGEGHSMVDGARVDWRAGSTVHIVGPQTVHQHFNDSDVASSMLRIAPGIRYFFQAVAAREHPFLRIEASDGTMLADGAHELASRPARG